MLFTNFQIRDCFVYNFNIACPSETAKTYREFQSIVKNYRLAAFPADHVGHVYAKFVKINFVGKHQAFKLVGLYSRYPHLIGLCPRYLERVAAFDLIGDNLLNLLAKLYKYSLRFNPIFIKYPYYVAVYPYSLTHTTHSAPRAKKINRVLYPMRMLQ